MAVFKKGLYAASRGEVFQFSEAEGRWIRRDNGLAGSATCLIASDTRFYAVAQRSRIFRWVEGSESWEQINDELFETGIQSLMIDGDTLYSGTAKGVVYRMALPK